MGGSFASLLAQRRKIHIDHVFIGSSDLDQASPFVAKLETALMGVLMKRMAKNPDKAMAKFSKVADAKGMSISTEDLKSDVVDDAYMQHMMQGFFETVGKVDIRSVPWMLKAFTHSDDEKMLKMFRAAAENVSLETLQNCTDEAFHLYSDMAGFDRRRGAKVSIWHGAKEPNMKKAVAAIRDIYPSAEDHSFEGLGHGDMIGDPERMAKEIEHFLGE